MPLPEKPILGQYLEKYLQKHKMLQKEFAALIGVQANTLSQWATGKRQPDNATLVLLAKTFGVSVDELLGVNPFDNFSKEPPAMASGELEENMIVFHRDGKTQKKKFTKEQMAMFMAMVDAIPDTSSDDI